jgi:DNA-binding Xre family transcriptional regulator
LEPEATPLPNSGFFRQFLFPEIPVAGPAMAERDSELRFERARMLENAMREKQWTRTALAKRAGYDEKTIRKVLNGQPVKDKTVTDVCHALDVEPIFRVPSDSPDVAIEQYGGYLRTNYHLYECFYTFYRRDILKSGVIYKSLFQIFWDSAERHLTFREYYKRTNVSPPVVQFFVGPVCISSYTNLLHMLTIVAGSVRLLTLTKMRHFEGIMRGVLLTQTEAPHFYQPTVTPVVLRSLSNYDADPHSGDDIILLSPDSPEYAFASAELQFAEREVMKIAQSQDRQ